MPRFRRAPRRACHTGVIRWLVTVGILLTGFLPLGPSTSATAQDAEPFITATVAPADAALYLRARLDPATDQWQQMLALLARANGSGSLAGLGLEDVAAATSDELGADLFLGGEAALIASNVAWRVLADEAVGAEATSSDSLTEIGVAFAITTPAPELLAAGLRAAISSTAQAVGTEVARTSVAGVTVMSVSVPAGSDETPLAFARVDDILLIGGFAADLVPAIEASQGERPALSEDSDFQRAQQVLRGDALGFGFARSLVSPEVSRILSDAGIPSPLAFEPGPPLAFSLAAEPAGVRLDAVVFNEAEVGAEFPAVSALTAAPADAMLFYAGQDLLATGLLQAFALLALGPPSGQPIPASAGEQAAQVREVLAPLSETFGTDLAGDLLERITGDYAFWVQRQAADGPVNALFTAQVDAPDRVRESLSQITFRIQSTLEGDDNITSRPIGERGRLYLAETGDATIPQVEYGVLGDELVVGLGSGAAGLGTATGDRLADTSLYDATMSELPAAELGALFINLELALPALLGAVEPVAGRMESAPASATPDDADADPACGAYADRDAAQAAYDSFAPGSFRLDRNFNGQACEHFFAAEQITAAATPVPVAAETGAESVTAGAVPALGITVYEEEGLMRVAGLLLVTDRTESEP